MFMLELLCASMLLQDPPPAAAATAPQTQPAIATQTQPAIATDERARELLERSVVIASIDPEDDEDFSDLQPLKKLIGDARLVVLGEQSHGDGADFLAKARLIKFLHQEMGFDVLTWESGMFDCREVDRALRDPGIKIDDISRLGIFPIWTFSAQVLPTLEYVRSTLATDHPIETAGFDHQFSGGAGSKWPASMIEFFDKADANLLPAEIRESLASGFAKMQEPGPNGRPVVANVEPMQEQWTRLGAAMDEHRAALVKAHGEAEFEFMRRTADDAVTSAKSLLEFIAREGKMKVTDNNTRDQRMAENLIWQVNERYKDRRIIAWMATMHAVNDIQAIKPAFGGAIYEGVINCGTVSKKALGETMYTIGFTAFDGQAGNVFGRAAPMLIPPPSKGSLEDLLGQTGKQFLFTDFRSLPADHWLRQPMSSRPLGYGEMKAEWPKQIDAMFYIRTMFPSTRENALPPYARLREDS